MSVLIFEDPIFARHETPPGHVERPGRYDAVEAALREGELAGLPRRRPSLCAAEAIERVHDGAYREEVFSRGEGAQGAVQFDADTFMGPSSMEAALRAAGGGVDAVNALFAGEARRAFVAARPPGHHAEPARAMGFCFFNSAAVAARHARAEHGAARITVVDFDVHHGNGTEAAFWHDEEAFFASSHEWPQYPGTGRKSDRGAFDNIVNAPLATGADGEVFRRAWGETILPALSDFDPDLIVISAGFDAHAADPLGGLELTEDDFDWATRELCAIADAQCEGRVVSMLEGGYDLAALGASAAAHVRALAG